ncbi:MAG: hypothetical protein DSZ02_08560 [Gammaproteobacteria bacterium]|nr:MAG: hypothetical protein DSZ02_08560 [Gammaproteobacteria bacterium]
MHYETTPPTHRNNDRSWAVGILVVSLLLPAAALAVQPPWSWPYYDQGTPPQPVAQQQTETTQPAPGYWGSYRYRPLQQRPGLPPNSSGTPTSSFSFSRSPDGSSYSYSYRVQRRGNYPYQQAPTPAAAMQAPTVEATISERRPLVQQNLIYRLRVFSSGNLKEVTPVLPQLESIIFRQLGAPESRTISADAQGNTLVTEYTYLVIPLREGTVNLPPPTISGRYTNNTPFEIKGRHGTVLYVQPARADVTPWLPLYDLQLEAHIQDQNLAKAGEPLTLEIITTAIGAVGSQLPSVADQLKSEDFYIYPGEVTEDGRISSDGLDLLGSRIERFTLVPRYGGRLTLPAMSLPWWNLRTGKAATATLPMRQFEVSGPVGESRATRGTAGLGEGSHLFFWIPLLLVALIMIAGWLKVILGDGRNPFGHWAGNRLRGVLGSLYQPLAAATHRLSPRRHTHRLRTWIGRHLPISWKLWYCLRAVDREEDPKAWEHALQILAAKHLGARPNASLEELGQAITACHPAANAREVRLLLRQLERANYGGEAIPSFGKWKEEFKKQIKPRLFPIRLRRCGEHTQEQGLPGLNPTS